MFHGDSLRTQVMGAWLPGCWLNIKIRVVVNAETCVVLGCRPRHTYSRRTLQVTHVKGSNPEDRKSLTRVSHS
ncbi:hypothetical protein ACN38_g9815 [Penicillium nordicum]|uniref:Uncharacterized protein n=1 Tax=Penicillium nordicum TaxID=229535 RepID=A0A0M8NTY5_9EURO|nr:hypothetical protein ACN38_g9815 [Penicillium nordicum]